MAIPYEVRMFLKKIKKDDYFMFRRLYENPKSFLELESDDDIKYNNDWILNNNFLDFMIIVCSDDDYIKRTWSCKDIWEMFQASIYYSIKVKEMYNASSLEEKINILDGKSEILENFRDSNENDTSLWIRDLFQRYEIYKTINNKVEIDRIEKYNMKKAKEALELTLGTISMINEDIKLKNKKPAIIKSILYDDCSIDGPEDTTLCMYWFEYSQWVISDAFYLFVCDNDFLNVIKQKIEEDNMGGIPQKNALNIINFGIEIKKRETIYYSLCEEYLGEKTINNFDLKLAEELVLKLQNRIYKEKHEARKVIKYSSYYYE